VARPGVAAERIVEIIKELEAQGQEATVTTVRKRLGNTGSYSTIGAVLSDWRERKAGQDRPSVPEAPELVRLLSHRVWEEAWSGAMKTYEPERQAFARERQESERTKAEMLAEIARLEADLETERNASAQATQAHAAERDGLREEVQNVRASLGRVDEIWPVGIKPAGNSSNDRRGYASRSYSRWTTHACC
jgi:hypothetical protein